MTIADFADTARRSVARAKVSIHLARTSSHLVRLRLPLALRRPRLIAITFGVADSSGGGDGVGARVVVGARDGGRGGVGG